MSKVNMISRKERLPDLRTLQLVAERLRLSTEGMDKDKIRLIR